MAENNRTNSGDPRQQAMAAISSELEKPSGPIMQGCHTAAEYIRTNISDSLIDIYKSAAEAAENLTAAMAADLEERGAAYTQELERLKHAAHQMDRAMHGAVERFASLRMSRADDGRSKQHA
jgi:hypothetical protein